jgi:hypothetical protein
MLKNIALITLFAVIVAGIFSQNGDDEENFQWNYSNLMRKISMGNLNRFTTDCYSSLMKVADRETQITCSAGTRITHIISIGVVAHQPKEPITSLDRKKIPDDKTKLKRKSKLDVGYAYCGNPKYLSSESNCNAILKEDKLKEDWQ